MCVPVWQRSRCLRVRIVRGRAHSRDARLLRSAVDRHTNSPLCGRPGNHPCQFVGENECIVSPAVINPHPASHVPRRMQFRAAGPQETVVWDPDEVVAAIVTCGGLCPGLNTVIRELVMCLTYTYGVKTVYGVPNGYRGCYMSDFVRLVPKEVSAIHLRGGTILGSSRGKFNLDSILEGVARYGVNHLYVIGGDGTHRGALSLAKGAIARKLKMAVVAIPKTIDNDIPVIDKSFGFDTAVEQAVHPINCVHTEALAAHNGIGIVKLMGRHAGFIAVQASLASRDVNVCLIPEARFSCRLLCEFLEKRLASSGHAVIVIAEGAQISNSDLEACGAAVEEGDTPKVDESGNPVLQDVGAFLRNYLKWHFKERAIDVNIKYIDPTYMIRSVAANASDTLLCADLAFAAVHGAFAGYTGFTVGTVAGQLVWIPIAAVAQAPPRRVDVESRMFARLLGNTGQPSLQERGEAVDTAESDTWSWAAGT